MTPKALASQHKVTLLWKRLPSRILINLFYQPKGIPLLVLGTLRVVDCPQARPAPLTVGAQRSPPSPGHTQGPAHGGPVVIKGRRLAGEWEG